MRAADVIVGETYGRWTVLGPYERKPWGEALFPCRCACGTERIVRFRGEFLGKSCGCLQREVASRARKHGDARERSRERLHRVWGGIKGRCYNPNVTHYGNYGGRGIVVCEQWLHDYTAFREWALSSGYEAHLDIDRIDNDGPYSPANCRWVTRSENLRNRRNNRLLTAWGETKVKAAWCDDDRCVVSVGTLNSRLRLGWTVEDALTLPVSTGRYRSRQK